MVLDRNIQRRLEALSIHKQEIIWNLQRKAAGMLGLASVPYPELLSLGHGDIIDVNKQRIN